MTVGCGTGTAATSLGAGDRCAGATVFIEGAGSTKRVEGGTGLIRCGAGVADEKPGGDGLDNGARPIGGEATGTAVAAAGAAAAGGGVSARR